MNKRIADQVGIAVAGMPGHRDPRAGRVADREFLAVREQVVELRSVRAGTPSPRSSTGAKVACTVRMPSPIASRAAGKALLEPVRRRQVIGVGMGFQYPLHLQRMCADVVNDGLCRRGADACRGRIEIQHRIDDRRLPAIRGSDTT